MLKRNTLIKSKRGQSTVEYIILVAAIIAVLIVFLAPGSPFRKSYDSSLSTGTNGMTAMAERLSYSHGTQRDYAAQLAPQNPTPPQP